MKHSTFLKFVAIVLCAASLLTLAGSGLGLWCMLELDLYNKTVEQQVRDSYSSAAMNFAPLVAQRYASQVLGGCPENLAAQQYSGWGWEYNFGDTGLGYAILDEEGNVLTEVNPDTRSVADHYFSIPVEGNYIHLVSSEPVEEKTTPEPMQGLGEGEYGIIDRVGEGIAPVYSIRISHNGGSEGIGSASPLGFLERLSDGSVQFQPNEIFYLQISGDSEITHITFMDMDEHILYEVADEQPVAIITVAPEGGNSIHLLKEDEKPVEIQMGTPVYQAIFYGTDGEAPIEQLSGTQPIGSASLDEEGNLNFQLYVESTALKEASGIFTLVLMDKDGTVLFGEAHPQLRTTVAPVTSPDGLNFTSHPDAVAVAMPAETIPVESIPETVPEETGAEETAEEGEESEAESEEEESEGEESVGEESEETEELSETTADTIPVETMPEETVAATIPVTVPETVPETVPVIVQETMPAPTEPVIINGKPLEQYDISAYRYFDNDTQQPMQGKVVHLAMPAYTVEVFIQESADRHAYSYTLMSLLRQFSGLLLPVLLGSLLVLALSTVYLCVAAGHRRTGEIKAGGLNRIPLDLYFILDTGIIIGLGALLVLFCNEVLQINLAVSLVLIPLMAYGICLVFVGFCFALVSQCKTPGGYWWRNSLCGRLLTGGYGSLEKGTDWTVKRFFPWLWKVVCKFWDICLVILEAVWKLAKQLWDAVATVLKRVLRWMFQIFRRSMDMLPLTWQWVLGGLVLMFFGLLVWANRNDGWGSLWLVVGILFLLYLSHSFGLLYEGAIRMNKGDLETKIDEKKMIGCFRNFAMDLNNLADVVVVAAQKQLRSERMKTELITNVSHDIKTPLTSIINYVDLLQKPHTEEQGVEYLEVLDRQSQRLKKLIDDLMDMSKANTGNMHVEITRLDAVESVNQALGEFADKLEKAELTPVFRHNTDEAFIMADGKLVWRVLSNLLSNAVKYAMPGTRLYLDLMNLDGRVILSLKNISRDELNVGAEELMERFVRGDDSRNTEGSGLGLNIAKSLMELQKGHLQLLVDGDLFKVTLVFPTAEK